MNEGGREEENRKDGRGKGKRGEAREVKNEGRKIRGKEKWDDRERGGNEREN